MSNRLIASLIATACIMAPLSAQAGSMRDFTDAGAQIASWLGVKNVLRVIRQADPAAAEDQAPAALPAVPVASPAITMAPITITKADLSALVMPDISALQAQAALPEPSTEKGLHKFYCVEYARLRSGLAVFGDAKLWWTHARNIYARAARPVEEAVMVFSGSRRLAHGHVAVVTDIVGPREIRVDQANWQNHGEIDYSTPVLDVSKDNDWSKVRVWDMPSHRFGARVYAISGFILKTLTKQASND